MKPLLSFLIVALLGCACVAYAQEASLPVEINGDQVQYSVTDNKVIATGNVVVKRSDVTLTCDRLEFDRSQNIGIAEGNVVLERKEGRLTGDKMFYNFTTMKGDFIEAKITFKPFYGSGKQITKVGENHIVLRDGYITTCDLDHPHFRLKAPKVDVYQGDKAVARNMTLVLGQLPVLWIPKYTQDLQHKKPMFVITPGYHKDWGTFVLTQWRHYWNDQVNTVVHLDYRSRRGWGEGVDLNYNSPEFGNGFMRMYYTQERFKDDKFFINFSESKDSVVEKERFKGEWRHKWDIDENTNAIWQYYKLSDDQFLKDFFEREYEDDTNPPTYFLLSRGFSSAGTLSLRSDVRVNRFTSAIDRLPEINYLLPGTRIFDSGFYWKNNTTYSNLAKLEPSPSVNRYETMRLTTDNQISYPFKVMRFLELRPFVGGEETFYTKTLSKEDNNTVRGIFKTGADVSTKFFRVYDVHSNLLNLDINRLRHVVTPSVAYFYTHDPTLEAAKLVQFDATDNLARGHGMTFGFENKLQTKRKGKSDDLVRLLLTSDFYLKEDTHKGGFNNVVSKMDVKPNEWVTVYSETYYDTIEEHLSNANFDVYLTDPKNKWSVSLGKRFDREVDDQITSQFNLRLNQKWYFEVYQRWDVEHGINKEQEYAFVRDLHEWEMKVSFNHKETDGDAIWIAFTLKEFPDLTLDFGSGFNKVKAGAR
ncbi:MAG: LPS assembly protein LptD [Candidatus Omnitrophica bacterium]|nr:LPS assembly protein LptD [Candidatus Omnitrophota bacterium]